MFPPKMWVKENSYTMSESQMNFHTLWVKMAFSRIYGFHAYWWHIGEWKFKFHPPSGWKLRRCFWWCISLALLIPFSPAFKQGGVRAMLLVRWFDSPFLMSLFCTHVFCSNSSHVVYHWLFKWGRVSESFFDSNMCTSWLVSVTLGFDYSLINQDILEGLLFRYFPYLY